MFNHPETLRSFPDFVNDFQIENIMAKNFVGAVADIGARSSF